MVHLITQRRRCSLSIYLAQPLAATPAVHNSTSPQIHGDPPHNPPLSVKPSYSFSQTTQTVKTFLSDYQPTKSNPSSLPPSPPKKSFYPSPATLYLPDFQPLPNISRFSAPSPMIQSFKLTEHRDRASTKFILVRCLSSAVYEGKVRGFRSTRRLVCGRKWWG